VKVLSLFSGCGGMDLGFIRAGHTIIWANDIFHDAAETYRLNIGNEIDETPIENVDKSILPPSDIVIGGFPCQGFSVANTKRSLSDSRNALYLQMLEVIRYVQPRYFVAENVKGILSMEKGEVFRMILCDFMNSGYSVKYALLNAANYGVPQLRERVFIVGWRDKTDEPKNFPPSPTHIEYPNNSIFPLKSWMTIDEAIAGLGEPDGVNDSAHTCSQYKLRFNGYLGHRVVRGDRPSPTITARGDERGGVVVIHHPSNTRRMTARELACIQGFPRDFQFFGSRTSIYRQVANAVPPQLAEAVARSLTTDSKS
jgi:DNA (cytosine-5)-methyltransferase 1